MYVILTDGEPRKVPTLGAALDYLRSLGERGEAATLMTAKWDKHHPAGGVIAQTLAERKHYHAI